MDGIKQAAISKENVFNQLKDFIVEVVGEDFIEAEDITIDSAFTEDLEMESIEIVQFADLVKANYGEGVDLTGWLSGMDLEDIINLKISTVVDYLVEAHAAK